MALYTGIIVLILNQILLAQPQIKLPARIKLQINGSEFAYSSDWLDSLVDDAYAGMTHYKIVGAKRTDSYVSTIVQIPQILTLSEVLRQIVLYYALLQNEETREMEVLNIFPYFKSAEREPEIKVQYLSEGNFDIKVNQWNTVPFPNQPIPEEKYIFNQILQMSFDGVQSLGDVPDLVFQEVATKNGLSVDKIRFIYQNTILWQIGSQIRAE